jgi:hypothetical protein
MQLSGKACSRQFEGYMAEIWFTNSGMVSCGHIAEWLGVKIEILRMSESNAYKIFFCFFFTYMPVVLTK